MRKNFVYYVLIPLVVVAIVVYLFIDRWVTSGLEAAGESIVGAKVEIEGVHVGLSPLGIRWRRMQVADPKDPWKNMFETGEAKLAVNFGQLLRGKYIIEAAEVNDVILGTKRTTDGSLPAAKETSTPPAESFSARAAAAISVPAPNGSEFSLESLKKGLNPDSLLATLDLRTLKDIDSLHRLLAGASAQWNASTDSLKVSVERFDAIKSSLGRINPPELKTPEKIQEAIATVNDARKRADDLAAGYNERKAAITSSIAGMSSAAASIDGAVKDDLSRLLGMARLPDLSTENLARLLVGNEAFARASRYLRWVDMAREKIRKYSPPPSEQPRRMKGQNISFPVERSYPKFWIKTIMVSGGTDSTQHPDYIHVRGEVKNVTSDQSVTGVPTTAEFEGTEGGRRALVATARFDRTQDTPVDEFTAQLSGVPVAEVTLGSAGFLPSRISHASLTSSLRLTAPGNGFDLESNLAFAGMSLEFAAEPRNMVEQIVRSVLTGITSLGVDLRLWTTGGSFSVALKTDLDNQIGERLKGVLGSEVRNLQDQLRSKLEEKIGPKRREFETLLGEKKSNIERRLAGFQSTVNEANTMIETKKKELADQLAKQQKGKAEDVLKKLFK